jgi:hypothetical protein
MRPWQLPVPLTTATRSQGTVVNASSETDEATKPVALEIDTTVASTTITSTIAASSTGHNKRIHGILKNWPPKKRANEQRWPHEDLGCDPGEEETAQLSFTYHPWAHSTQSEAQFSQSGPYATRHHSSHAVVASQLGTDSQAGTPPTVAAGTSTSGTDSRTVVGIPKAGFSAPNPDRPRFLALPNDSSNLNELHCFIRAQLLEIFVVKPSLEPQKYAVGRVGLRCAHCHWPRTSSVNGSHDDKPRIPDIYPTSVDRIYELVRMWNDKHVPNCKSLPPPVRQAWKELQETEESRKESAYYAEAARQIGLMDCSLVEGIRFETETEAFLVEAMATLDNEEPKADHAVAGCTSHFAAPPSDYDSANWQCKDASEGGPVNDRSTFAGNERNDRRHDTRNLKKRSGDSNVTDRHHKQPRLDPATRMKESVPEALSPTLNPRKPSGQVSVALSAADSFCVQGQASPSVVVTATGNGASTHPPDGSESPVERESLLDFMLQILKECKGRQSTMLKECQGLINRRNHLSNEMMDLFQQMKQANPSLKLESAERDSKLDDEVVALATYASWMDEHNGNRAGTAVKWVKLLCNNLEKADLLQQKLTDIVKLKESELASRRNAFEDWKRSRKAWEATRDELSREETKLSKLLHRVKEEKSNHEKAAPLLLLP